MINKTRFCAFVFAISLISTAHAQYGYESAAGKHRGAVTALLDAGGRILSAGEDGFIVIWNRSAAEERFQVSRYAIKFMALRPGKPEAAVVESDGSGINSVSVWNYETRKRLFTLRFRDSVLGINYSAAGNFLIVSQSGSGGTVLLDPETGEALDSPELPPSITLASTGLSERNMLCYQPSGVLSYWSLSEGRETQRFNVPSNIQNPVLLGNNRFMAGFDSGGLLVLDAVTGSVLGREEDIRQGSVFIETADSARFYCVSTNDSSCSVYRMDISPFGVLTTIESRALFINEVNRGIFADEGNIILGAGSGDLWLVGGDETRVLETQNQEGILDIAVSSSTIALLSENGTIVYLPLDYSVLEDDFAVTAEAIGGNQVYTGVSSSPLPSESRFLLWENGRSTPMVISPNSRIMLDKFPMRSHIRTAAMLGGYILFLDTTGVISILDYASGETLYSSSAAGTVDAAFVDIETIVLGGYAAPGNTPFTAVNFLSGETTPLAYPGSLGLKVYRSGSGAVYAAVIDQEAGNVSTSIIALDLSNPAESQTIVEYDGEEPFIAMAESGGNFAATLGSGMAALYRDHQTRPEETEDEIPFFEGGSFPVKIIDGGRFFVVLDGEGAVSWHDNQTGASLAVFRLYQDLWILEKTTPQGPNTEITRGGVIIAPPRP
jgi:WD40 repeat protein